MGRLMGMVGWIFPYYCMVPSFFIGCHFFCCRSDFLVLRGRFSLFAVGIPLFAGCIFLFAVFPFPFVPVFMPAVCCFAACMAFLPDVGVDFCLCVFVDIQHFVKYFTVLGKKVGKIFGIGWKNALSLHPLSEGGAPAGKDGGEGRAGKEGERRSGRGNGESACLSAVQKKV